MWEGVCGREPADRVKKSGEIRDSLERPGPLFLVVVTEGGTELFLAGFPENEILATPASEQASLCLPRLTTEEIVNLHITQLTF